MTSGDCPFRQAYQPFRGRIARLSGGSTDNGEPCRSFRNPRRPPKALPEFWGNFVGRLFQLSPVGGVEHRRCVTGSTGPGINGAILQNRTPRTPS